MEVSLYRFIGHLTFFGLRSLGLAPLEGSPTVRCVPTLMTTTPIFDKHVVLQDHYSVN